MKEVIVGKFLDFVGEYVPLREARLATLGGKGMEARVWAEKGIPHDHGWLIERSRERSTDLINDHRYQTQNQLSTFPQILQGHDESHAYIDGFHLDLCGTFTNRVISEFSPAFELIIRGGARCLSITIADQRRNLALEQWSDVRRRGRQLIGIEVSKSMYESFIEEQRRLPVGRLLNAPAFIKPFDPIKGAKREFGLLVEMSDILSQFIASTDRVERYVYVSRTSGTPFRMRTYFFHFTSVSKSKAGKAGLHLAKCWIKNPIHFVEKNGEINQTKGKLQMQQSEPQMSKLEKIAEIIGGEEHAEYLRLKSDSGQLHVILGALAQARVVTGASSPTNHASVNTINARTAETESIPRRTYRTGRATNAKRWEALSESAKFDWLIKVLERRTDNGGKWAYGEWEKLIENDFGQYDVDFARSLRATLARTSGKFRPNFILRIKEALPADEAKGMIDRLQRVN